jgi:hypothetical protein
MPRWMSELHHYEANQTMARRPIEQLIAQISVELQSLTKFATNSEGNHVLVSQQHRLCEKLVGRLEVYMQDDPSIVVHDNMVLAALDKRRVKREQASREMESQGHNERQLELNRLIALAGRDVDLIRDLAGQQKLDASWNRTLAVRLKATGVAILEMLADTDAGTLDTSGIPLSVTEWLGRTAKLLDQERLKKELSP